MIFGVQCGACRATSTSSKATSPPSMSTPSSMPPTRRSRRAAACAAPSTRRQVPSWRRLAPSWAAALTGEAKMTPGFRLPARHVIHAVGPVWGGGEQGEGKRLAACYRNALDHRRRDRAKSIAFPAISTGIYGYPPDRAAFIAARTVRESLADYPSIERVVFCCFGAGVRSSSTKRRSPPRRRKAERMAKSEAPVIVWFRRDLRLADNAALTAAAKSGRTNPARLHSR